MMCSETVAPRLSFSYDDLADLDDVPRKDTLLLQESNHDFEFFSASRSSVHEFEYSCSADELFSNGIILPTIQMKQRTTRENPHVKLLPPRPSQKENKREKVIQVNAANTNHEKKTQSKSFWGFGKSRSLNCDAARKSFLSSLPPLSRSNSAGSAPPNPKRTSSYKQQQQQQQHPRSASASAAAKAMNLYPSGSVKKSHANGHRISPVLNVPTPCCISKGGAGLFGLGSLLRVGKVKKTKN